MGVCCRIRNEFERELDCSRHIVTAPLIPFMAVASLLFLITDWPRQPSLTLPSRAWSRDDLDQEVVACGNTTLRERSASEDHDVDGHAQGGVGADRVTRGIYRG